MGEEHRTYRWGGDRPENQRRLTVHDAARRLGISEDAVRMRVKRGTLPSEREGERLYVLLTPDPTTEPTDRTDELIRTLREQLEAERQAHAEARRIIAELVERIPPAIEAPSQARESAMAERRAEKRRTETPDDVDRSPEAAAQWRQAAAERRRWTVLPPTPAEAERRPQSTPGGAVCSEGREMSISRIDLVELIEGETAKLSPRGRELWERLELHVEATAPEEATPETLPPPDREQLEVADRMAELPWPEQAILERLMELLAGLRSSDYAESRGQPGEPRRNQAVLLAASIKDRHEGRQINPDMTPEQTAARLRGSS